VSFALVAEPTAPIAAALKIFLQSAGVDVQQARNSEDAFNVMRQREPELVFAAASPVFDGESFCARLKAATPHVPVVLVYPAEVEGPELRASRAGADTFLVLPLKRAAVVSTLWLIRKARASQAQEGPARALAEQYKVATEQLKAALEQVKGREEALKAQLEVLKAEKGALEVSGARERERAKALEVNARELLAQGERAKVLEGQVEALKAREAPMRERIDRLEAEALELSAQVGRMRDQLKEANATRGSDSDFFKRFLALEVKRSRRYQCPVAVLFAGLDGLPERLGRASHPELLRQAVRFEALKALNALVRDIDLVVAYGDDRYVALLPHTGREGALTVAGRVQAKLSALPSLEGGTGSVGVSFFDPKAAPRGFVSFGRLMREASLALTEAQQAGGAQVKSAPSPEAPRRDRISLA